MSRITTEIRELLAPLDPAPEEADPSPGIRRRVLSHAIEQHRAVGPERGPRARPWRLVVAVVAVIIVGVSTVSLSLAGSGDRAEAATPGPYEFTRDEPAAERLERLADRAASLPPASLDGVWYVRSAGWALQSNVSGNSTDSALAQVVTERWIAPGQTTEIVDDEGPPIEPGRVPQIGLDTSPGPNATEQVKDSATLVGSGLSDPLATEALLGSIYDGAPAPYRYFGGALTVLASHPLGSDDLSGLYRFLSTVNGIRYRGTVHDRAGRPGEAFTVTTDHHGLQTEYVLVVDADTGTYLGHEEVITGDPGALDVTTPAVVSYRVQLEVAVVAQPGDQP